MIYSKPVKLNKEIPFILAFRLRLQNIFIETDSAYFSNDDINWYLGKITPRSVLIFREMVLAPTFKQVEEWLKQNQEYYPKVYEDEDSCGNCLYIGRVYNNKGILQYSQIFKDPESAYQFAINKTLFSI